MNFSLHKPGYKWIAKRNRANRSTHSVTGGLILLRVPVILCALTMGNLILWFIAVIIFRKSPVLLGTAALAYALGLRHALDADHIAAIDNVTRRLVNANRRPVATGFFFALGHSTIVLLLAVLIALTAGRIHRDFPMLQWLGDMAGPSLSALFLLAMGLINVLMLRESLTMLRQSRHEPDGTLPLAAAPRGPLTWLLMPLLRITDRSWKMYPVGLLFGLGFDTATEVGVLSISAATVVQNLSLWTILLFPAIFSAGMILVDAADGIMMARAYGWAVVKSTRNLYYNVVMTSVTVVVALVIGTLEIVGLARQHAGEWLSGAVAEMENHFAMIGSLMIAVFLTLWLVLWLIQNFKASNQSE